MTIMAQKTPVDFARPLREVAHPLRGEQVDYDPLLEAVGDARFILLGEASHGTHEFYEALFHEMQIPDFLLPLRERNKAVELLSDPRLERAIGVIYLPQTERMSHYFTARLPAQFDMLLHFDETHAVEPLDRTEQWERREAPETYPTAL